MSVFRLVISESILLTSAHSFADRVWFGGDFVCTPGGCELDIGLPGGVLEASRETSCPH